MPAFYRLEYPSERTYQYAWRDTAVRGLRSCVCEACGRTVSVWEYDGPHCLFTEGGPQYPDYLPFTGAGGPLFVLSETAVRAFEAQGITGITDTASIQVLRERSGGMIPLSDGVPGYLLTRIGGRIELDLQKMCLKRKKLCTECGRFEWNRQRLYPLHLVETTWDGSDICRVAGIPGYIVCTDRVVKLVKAQKLKGFCFKPL